MKKAPIPEDLTVMHENWKAWRLFMDCQSQWRWLVSPNGAATRIALDLSAVVAVLQLNKPKNPKKLLRKVVLIQQGAIAAMNNVSLETIFGE